VDRVGSLLTVSKTTWLPVGLRLRRGSRVEFEINATSTGQNIKQGPVEVERVEDSNIHVEKSAIKRRCSVLNTHTGTTKLPKQQVLAAVD
jgi:hypothetical protein